MKHYVTYNDQGRVLQSGICADCDLQLQATAGRYVLEGEARDDVHYVRNGAIVARPANPATLKGFLLTNVPVPSTVWINNTRYNTDEADVDLAFTYPGAYEIRVESFPYLDATFTVTI